jgi:hypothetical protein
MPDYHPGEDTEGSSVSRITMARIGNEVVFSASVKGDTHDTCRRPTYLYGEWTNVSVGFSLALA